MNKFLILTLSVGALATTGCASLNTPSVVYFKPGVETNAFISDYDECYGVFKSGKPSSSMTSPNTDPVIAGAVGGFQGIKAASNLMTQCYKQKGYQETKLTDEERKILGKQHGKDAYKAYLATIATQNRQSMR